jgi:hypothetical protein
VVSIVIFIANGESISIQGISYERSSSSISIVTLAKFETTPVDTTVVAIKIAIRKLTRSDYRSQLLYHSIHAPMLQYLRLFVLTLMAAPGRSRYKSIDARALHSNDPNKSLLSCNMPCHYLVTDGK